MSIRDTDITPIHAIIDFLSHDPQGASIQEISHNLKLNRNLVAKNLAILHMQGRLDLRTYGNIKIYRIANRISFQSLSLFAEDLILGFSKSLIVRMTLGDGFYLFGTHLRDYTGLHISQIGVSELFTPDFIEIIRDIIEGNGSSITRDEMRIGPHYIRIKVVPCFFNDGAIGAALLCSDVSHLIDKHINQDKIVSRYNTILDEMQDFFVHFTHEWLIHNVNTSFALYCASQPDDLIGQTGLPLVSSDDMDRIIHAVFDLEIDAFHEITLRVTARDGSVRWQTWKIFPQYEEEVCSGYHCFGRDITDLKLKDTQIEQYHKGFENILHQKTEELRETASQLRREIDDRRALEKELMQREELYRSLTESTSDIVWEIDADNRFSFVNDRVKTLLGYEPSEIIGTSPGTYFNPDEYLPLKNVFLTSKELVSPIDPTRVQVLTQKGENAWIEISGVPVFKPDGSFQGYRGVGRDITTKIRTDLEKQHLLSIIENTPDLIAMGDDKGNVLYLNKAGRHIIRISEDVDIQTLNNRNFMAPESRDIISEGRKKALEEGSWMGDTIFMATDGTKIHMSQVILAHKQMPGESVKTSTIARNISERLEIEKKLAHAYAYNRTLIEVNPDPLVTIGLDGKIQDVNVATEIVTGVTRSKLIGTDFRSYFTEPEKSDFGHQKVFNDGFVQDFPLELLHVDGSIIPVLFNAVVYRDEEGVVQGVLATARDITYIKHYQDHLANSLLMYRNILDTFPNPIWGSGIDSKCNYFNKAWIEFTGRSLEDELGDGWISGVHPEDLDRCVSQYVKSFEQREPFCMMYRLHHQSGTYHWISDFGSPLYNQDNEFVGYIGSCYDIDKYLLEMGVSDQILGKITDR